MPVLNFRVIGVTVLRDCVLITWCFKSLPEIVHIFILFRISILGKMSKLAIQLHHSLDLI